MKQFTKTKFFVHQIDEATGRFDLEYLDPCYRSLDEYFTRLSQSGDYEIWNLGGLCDVFDGKTTGYAEEGIPVLKVANVTGKGINWETDYVDEEFYLKNPALNVKADDVLLTSTGDGTIGRADMTEWKDKDVQKAIPDGHVTIIRRKAESQNKVLPRFLLYYLRSGLGQMQMERLTTGSTGQTELNETDLRTLKVALPTDANMQGENIALTLEYEKQASQFEGKTDEMLAQADSLLSEFLGFKLKDEPSKFYALKLGESDERMDFVFNDPFYEKYRVMQDKSKYPFVELGKVVAFSSESTNPLERPDEPFQYVDIGNIDLRWGRMAPETLMGFEAKSSRIRRLVHSGQVVVSMTRPTRRAIAVVPEEMEGQVCSTGFAVLNCNKELIDRDYLFYILRSSLISHQFERYSSGAGYPEINKEKDLPRIRIPCPNELDVQREIVGRIGRVVSEAQRIYNQAEEKRKQAISEFEGFFPDIRVT